jgi:holo-[acyl-carrier protein] synthase
MVIGIGTDAISIPRLRNLKERFGNRFLNRVFTPSEKKYCNQYGDPSQHYAVRFAAKEATAKALGVGFGKELSWKDIVVANDELGKPFIKFRNAVAKKIKKNGYKCHLSMAHCTDYATAVSILELEPK